LLAASGGFWRATDRRNWRKRIYKPTAEAIGIDGAGPYDLRHAFASLLIHEGRLSVVEIAA
jgi:integrase